MSEKEIHKKQMMVGVIAIIVLALIYFVPGNNLQKTLPGKQGVPKVDEEKVNKIILNSISESIASSTANGSMYTPVSVMYTTNGFAPNLMQVYAGQKIIFTNTTSKSGMQIVTDSIPAGAQKNSPQFGQSSPVGKGEKYEYLFTTEGTYDYYSKSNSGAHAKIIVVKQKF